MATNTLPWKYEERLRADRGWGLDEGGLHFEGKSLVRKTLNRLGARLRDLDIPYAAVGGMALFAHGYERFTTDVDILTTPEALAEIHEKLEGRGYLPPFTGSKQLRDTETGVRIEFLVAGQFPGDGKPKAIAFPDPAEVGVEIDGIRYVDLPTLVTLKLASGMTGGVGRMKDLSDVVELAKAIDLPVDFADRLHPYVRAKFVELIEGLRSGPRIGPDGDPIVPE